MDGCGIHDRETKEAVWKEEIKLEHDIWDIGCYVLEDEERLKEVS
jgi:hypothetical protein